MNLDGDLVPVLVVEPGLVAALRNASSLDIAPIGSLVDRLTIGV